MEYFDLFDPGGRPLPEGAQLPPVLVNNRVVSSGGKVSIPVIRKRLEESGANPIFRSIGNIINYLDLLIII